MVRSFLKILSSFFEKHKAIHLQRSPRYVLAYSQIAILLQVTKTSKPANINFNSTDKLYLKQVYQQGEAICNAEITFIDYSQRQLCDQFVMVLLLAGWRRISKTQKQTTTSGKSLRISEALSSKLKYFLIILTFLFNYQLT